MQQKAKFEIYTWDHCPYCQRALALLNSKNIEYTQHKLDGDEAAREEMSKNTIDNRKSVPQIFIDGTNIGGCDDLHAMNDNGELDKFLA